MRQPARNTSVTAITKVIVVGTSAGGLNALKRLINQLPEDFPVPVLVVQHVASYSNGQVLLDSLNKLNRLTCVEARDGADLRAGYLYLALPDHHLMLNREQKILITKGATENRSRPAIDPLFRSAAVAFGNGVIGILLTGNLDDGTAGMNVIKRCGGVCIVQDPADADYPDMPQNALNHVKIDHSVPLSEMGELLQRLALEKPGKRRPVPKDILIEAAIAERLLSTPASVDVIGEQVPFNCPDCGGVLWEIKDCGTRFRCFTGHAYTAASLLVSQTHKIEETMWAALRMFEERKNLLINMSQKHKGALAKSARERADSSQVHIDRIRLILNSGNPAEGLEG